MIRIGRWSELSACIVVQSVFLCSVFVMVVMSGEVGCWFTWGGMRVGVFVFSVIWLEFAIMSAISDPRWSSVVECHWCECAFMSPVIRWLSMLVRWVKVFVMSVSSVAWFGSVVSLGGM